MDPLFTIEELIRRPAREAQELLDKLYSAEDPSNGSPLDQNGLRDGFGIVQDFLNHGEAGVAFEHLLYMISEPPLTISKKSIVDIQSAAERLGMSDLLRLHLGT